jgi:adenylate cyclase
VAPEKDFISFIGRNSRVGLAMSLVIVGLTAAGAAIVVRQGFRVDRTTRLVRDRERAIARQGAALDHLADQADMFGPSQDNPPDVLTETAADITGARRASLWYLVQDGRLMHCADSFDRQTSVHSSGLQVERSELPRYFDHLAAGEEIDVVDAAGDRRTAEVHRLILTPLGSRALLSVPMRRRGMVVGAVWLEDPVDTAEPRQFLRVLASLAALRADRTSAPARARRLDPEVSPAEPEAVRSRTAELSVRGLDATALGDAFYPEVCVLVVRVDDLACAAFDGAPDLINSVAQVIQEVAAKQEIPYLKLVGCEVVAAAGFTTGDPTAVMRIANTAVAGRDRLTAVFEARRLGPEFRLGIDFGIGIGSSVGTDPKLFNLWGETLSTARRMADSAFAGAIQTSDAIYLRLRQEFLFRPRGTFYLPGVGARQTFILAGRL